MSTSSRKFTVLASAIVGLLLLAPLSAFTRAPADQPATIANPCAATTNDPSVIGTIDWTGPAPFVAKYGATHTGPWTLTAAPGGIVATYAAHNTVTVARNHADIFDGAHHCVALTLNGSRLHMSVASI